MVADLNPERINKLLAGIDPLMRLHKMSVSYSFGTDDSASTFVGVYFRVRQGRYPSLFRSHIEYRYNGEEAGWAEHHHAWLQQLFRDYAKAVDRITHINAAMRNGLVYVHRIKPLAIRGLDQAPRGCWYLAHPPTPTPGVYLIKHPDYPAGLEVPVGYIEIDVEVDKIADWVLDVPRKP